MLVTRAVPTVHLKTGHVQAVWAGHPWVYAQAIERVEGGASRGDEVKVVDPRGNFIGRGFYSPGSAIPVRILVRDEKTKIDESLFRTRIERAFRFRKEIGLGTDTTGFRVVHAEGDGLPGLIIDRFNDVLVIQFLTFGMKVREGQILESLRAVFRPRTILDRTPENIAKLEGFTATRGVVRGDEIDAMRFQERNLLFEIPIEMGQKTGFYFDQRPLRARVEELAKGKRVLDGYSFVGAFGMSAARGGAREVVSVDESALALEVAADGAARNGLADRMQFICADARTTMQNAHGSFDLTIVDPPRLAPKRSAKDAALMLYSKLAELGCRATKPGGDVVLCSCSSAVDFNALTRALANGAQKANMSATIWERHFQGPDHPVNAAFPEGLYLKALIARVDTR